MLVQSPLNIAIFPFRLQPLTGYPGFYRIFAIDSIAGIGTMSFFDTKTGCFAGLGHPICDSDTGGIVPVHSGEAVPVKMKTLRMLGDANHIIIGVARDDTKI